MALRAALFDVDGTLIDSNESHARAWQRALRDFGIDVSLAAVRQQMGNGGERVVRALCTPGQAHALGKDLVQRHAEIFTRDYLDSVRPFPGVVELFERLRADGVRIALACSARKWERDRYIARLGIGHLLDAATTGRSAKHTKPQPDVFRAALARLGGVARDEAVVVGDSPYDAEAARRGGMQAIGVLTGGFPKQRLWEAGARMVFRDIEDLLESYEASPFAEARQLVA